MSYTNSINDETIIIMQGIGGIRLCEEAWMKGNHSENTNQQETEISAGHETTHNRF